VNLKVEMAADRAGVAGLADGADPLAGIDEVATTGQGWTGHVGVEVAAALPYAVDEEVVAVEDPVIAAAGRTELADGTAGPVGPGDREDVVVIRDAAVGGRTGGGWGGEGREEEES
jgi:hypothetical protein